LGSLKLSPKVFDFEIHTELLVFTTSNQPWTESLLTHNFLT